MTTRNSNSNSNSNRSTTRASLQDNLNLNLNHPSFSSTLLEEIYRSFDEERENNHHQNGYRKSTMMMMKKSSSSHLEREKENNNHRFVIDQWIENERIKSKHNNLRQIALFSDSRRPMNHSSSTSSSDSSSGIGGFSSSDTDSLYGYSSSTKLKSPARLKPIRTTVSSPEIRRKSEIPAKSKQKKEGNLNLQRRALKLYGDLKKVKQPISPGGKLASFLNSIFNGGNSKKQKMTSSVTKSDGQKVVRETVSSSAPSTTTSFSRSCLSKTPSSAGRFEKRSVRFVDNAVDERPHWRRNGGGGGGGGDVAKRDSSTLANDEEFKLQVREKHRRVEEVAKELLKNYHNNNRKDLKVNIVTDDHYGIRKYHNVSVNNINNNIRGFEDDDEDEEDEDGSCCSSDLFELDNLLDHGDVDRYREELPVYETTHVGKNRAIANGFIL